MPHNDPFDYPSLWRDIMHTSTESRQRKDLCALLNQSLPHVEQTAANAFYHFFIDELAQHPTTFSKAMDKAQKINQALRQLFAPDTPLSSKTEKTLLSYLPAVSKETSENLFALFHHTSFLDKIIEKNNSRLIRYALEQYQANPKYLGPYLLSDRFGHTDKNEDAMRFRFFFLSPVFNDIALQLLPASFFLGNGIPLALSVNAQIHNPTRTGLLAKQKAYFDQLSPETERSFFRCLSFSLLNDPIPPHKIIDILPLLEHAYHSPHTAYQALFADLLLPNRYTRLNAQHQPILDTLLASKLTPAQSATLLHTLCATSDGYDTALKATLTTKETPDKSLLWHTLDEGTLPYMDQHARQLTERALNQSNEDIIFGAKKKLPPADSPIFIAFRDYFQGRPTQALRFLDTFSDVRQNPAAYWNDMSQFVQVPAARLKLFSHYHIIHHWAKLGEYTKIQNFFCEHNLPAKTREFFWRQKDSAGRTPWHVICACHHKEFFKKMTPSMRRTFIELLHTPDNSGKTLIDLIYANTKIMKLTIQLIPDLKQAFIDAGYRIDTVKLTEKVAPVTLVPEPIPTPPATQKTPWNIIYIGHDNERKNADFIRLVETEIADFPEPYSSALRERQNREMKPQTYNVAAFKITYSGKAWRVPYITNGTTFYVFPSRERDHAYDDTQADYIKKLAQQLKRQTTQAKRVAHQTKPTPTQQVIFIR